MKASDQIHKIYIFKILELKIDDGQTVATMECRVEETEPILFSRTLAEFDRLYQYLVKVFPSGICPATPPKSVDFALVEWGLELFLNRIGSHLTMNQCQKFIDFINSEFLVYSI